MLNPTSAIIIIGNEILSGMTQDINIRCIAQKLSEVGIKVSETRIIPDNKRMIIEAVSALKEQYDYVFTTGGIGPTHDDITTAAIAEALDLPLVLDQKIFAAIKDSSSLCDKHADLLAEKMALLPLGSKLINSNNSQTQMVPGFNIKNIYVLPGIPSIMHHTFEQLLPSLKHGPAIVTKQLDVTFHEDIIAVDFSSLQCAYPLIEMGSYPFKKDEQDGTSLVLRSSDVTLLEQAYQELLKILELATVNY